MTPAAVVRRVQWVCPQCAYDAGAKPYKGHIATYHLGTCQVCDEKKQVTEPRDFDWRGVPNK